MNSLLWLSGLSEIDDRWQSISQGMKKGLRTGTKANTSKYQMTKSSKGRWETTWLSNRRALRSSELLCF